MYQICHSDFIMWVVDFNARLGIWLFEELCQCCLASETGSPRNYNINVRDKFLYNLQSPIIITVVTFRIGTSLTCQKTNHK
jgi:hypothetical protein